MYMCVVCVPGRQCESSRVICSAELETDRQLSLFDVPFMCIAESSFMCSGVYLRWWNHGAFEDI